MTIGYLAGFFAGQGSIRIKVRRDRKPHLKLQIGQKETAVLDELVSTYGGWIESGGVGQVKRWVIYGSKAKAIAEAMFPYLIVKRDKVIEILGILY